MQQADTSVRALILQALEQTYSETRRTAYVTAPLVNGKGKLAPLFLVDENPREIVFARSKRLARALGGRPLLVVRIPGDDCIFFWRHGASRTAGSMIGSPRGK